MSVATEPDEPEPPQGLATSTRGAVAGIHSISDIDLMCHDDMSCFLNKVPASSTSARFCAGSPSFMFRQLGAATARLLARLKLTTPAAARGRDEAESESTHTPACVEPQTTV